MKSFAALIILILLFSGCGPEYADDEAVRINKLSEADNPEVAIARDMIAAALRYDIDRFVEKHRPRLNVCFLSVLDEDPADELIARLEGTKLEVHKFSEWTTYFRDENGSPVMPERFFRISIRDVRIIDETHAEVDTQWSASGIYIPGETFTLESFVGAWRVTNVKITP